MTRSTAGDYIVVPTVLLAFRTCLLSAETVDTQILPSCTMTCSWTDTSQKASLSGKAIRAAATSRVLRRPQNSTNACRRVRSAATVRATATQSVRRVELLCSRDRGRVRASVRCVIGGRKSIRINRPLATPTIIRRQPVDAVQRSRPIDFRLDRVSCRSEIRRRRTRDTVHRTLKTQNCGRAAERWTMISLCRRIAIVVRGHIGP